MLTLVPVLSSTWGRPTPRPGLTAAAGGFEHGRLGDERSDRWSARRARPSTALVPSRRMTTGELSFTRPMASMIPLATSSTRVMPPKMLTRIDFTAGSALITSSAAAMTSAFAPPPMSRKLAALPPAWVTTSSVLMARPAPLAMMPTLPGEADVVEALLLGHLLARVNVRVVLVLLPLGVAERGVLVERHLGVECVHLALGGEDQRVDLGQVTVAFHVAVVEADQERCRLLTRLSVEVGPVHPLPRRLLRQTGHRVDVDLGDGIGVGLGHLLDLDPALGREHAEVQLGRAVEGEAGVVLLGDVGGVLDPEALHHVALDVEPEDVAGVQAHLVGVGGQLHAAGLAAATHLHLRLDHDRVAR